MSAARNASIALAAFAVVLGGAWLSRSTDDPPTTSLEDVPASDEDARMRRIAQPSDAAVPAPRRVPPLSREHQEELFGRPAGQAPEDPSDGELPEEVAWEEPPVSQQIVAARTRTRISLESFRTRAGVDGEEASTLQMVIRSTQRDLGILSERLDAGELTPDEAYAEMVAIEEAALDKVDALAEGGVDEQLAEEFATGRMGSDDPDAPSAAELFGGQQLEGWIPPPREPQEPRD